MTCSSEWWWILSSETGTFFAADPLKMSPELTCVTYVQNCGPVVKLGLSDEFCAVQKELCDERAHVDVF